jgi:hypothetical protein
MFSVAKVSQFALFKSVVVDLVCDVLQPKKARSRMDDKDLDGFIFFIFMDWLSNSLIIDHY